MEKTISISGMTVVTVDENKKVTLIQFLPDDEMAPIMEVGSHSYGALQQMRNGAFDSWPVSLGEEQTLPCCARRLTADSRPRRTVPTS